MKIKILKALETVKGKIRKGRVLNVKPHVAEKWIAEGVAEAYKNE